MDAGAVDFSGPFQLGAKKTPCRFAAHAENNGTPASGADLFRIQVYSAKGVLIHQASCIIVDGSSLGGGLFVLKGNAYLRLSVGGPDSEPVKIEKLKKLARKALPRLP